MIKPHGRYIINILKQCQTGFQSHCANLHYLQERTFVPPHTHQHFVWWVFLILALQIGVASHCDFNLYFSGTDTKFLFVFVIHTSSIVQLLKSQVYPQIIYIRRVHSFCCWFVFLFNVENSYILVLTPYLIYSHSLKVLQISSQVYGLF